MQMLSCSPWLRATCIALVVLALDAGTSGSAHEGATQIADVMNKQWSLIRQQPAPIVIASQCGGKYYKCDSGAFTRAYKNHQDYARKHGYEYVLLEQALSKRPKVWDRYPLISLLHNRGAEWVLYVDADALFMNTSVTVESFIEEHGSGKDLVLSGDGFVHFQAGVFLMRRSPWTHAAMCNAWKVCPSPGWDELGAMMTVLGGGDPNDVTTWKKGFKKLLGSGITWFEQQSTLGELPQETSEHLALLPQRAMDSYTKEALDRWDGHDRNDIQYQPGDWIVHFAGTDSKLKKHLMPKWTTEKGFLSVSKSSCETPIAVSSFQCGNPHAVEKIENRKDAAPEDGVTEEEEQKLKSQEDGMLDALATVYKNQDVIRHSSAF